MVSYRYKNSNHNVNTVERPSYFYNWNKAKPVCNDHLYNKIYYL